MRCPIGFRPWEISALVNPDIVSRHAAEAAFLWTQRRRACSAPHYALRELMTLDERLQANLEGLQAAPSDFAWDQCKGNFEHLGAGEVFTAAILAFGSEHRERMRDVLWAACTSPQTRAGLISALGWLPFAQTERWLRLLLQSTSPEHRLVGLAGYAGHRQDPGSALDRALADEHAPLRARAMRAAGELRRVDVADALAAHLGEESDACGFWSAWALTLSGRLDGLDALAMIAAGAGPWRWRAAEAAVRFMSPARGREWISALVQNTDAERLAVKAVGMIGDPVAVPWLIRKMNSPALSRVAGEAFSMITGIDLALLDLTHESAEANNAEPADDDIALPCPSPDRVDAWWQQNHLRFAPGARFLCGSPVSRSTALDVLLRGRQRQRRAAALELARIDATVPLFETSAFGALQFARCTRNAGQAS